MPLTVGAYAPPPPLTYRYAAAAGKRHRLREARVWIDPPAYYDPPGGLLAFDIDQPERLVHPAGGMSVQGHIELINHQLAQVRDGLARTRWVV